MDQTLFCLPYQIHSFNLHSLRTGWALVALYFIVEETDVQSGSVTYSRSRPASGGVSK